MPVAQLSAIFEALPLLPAPRATREPVAPPRLQKKWIAPSAITRGQLIDLLV
jgi:hypothetical protein